MATPSRLTNGLSTLSTAHALRDFPLPDYIHTSSSVGKQVFSYINDFTDIGTTTANTITGVASTFALVNGVGGIAVATPGGAATVTTVARTAASFQFVTGNKFWYVTRVQTSGVGAGVITRFGLQVGNVANTTNDSIYFTKATGAAGAISLVSTVATVATTLVPVCVAVTAAATWVDMGFYYDGTDLNVFVSDQNLARIPGVTIGAAATTLTNGLLTPFIQITPVASETLSQDYVMVAQETTR
jgi:hypothetical protein